MKHKLKKWHIALMSICVLLITILASMFSLNATTPVSTDDEELLDDNWELGIVFYDAAIGNGKTPLTEFNWHAKEWTERKDIIIQINYKNDNTITSYNAGSLKITIPKLQSYNGYFELYDITAGADSSIYDWNYSYSGNNIVITNNVAIEEKTNFEGSIQLSFRPTPYLVKNGLIQNFQATLKNSSDILAESNTIALNYTSEPKTHTIEKRANKIGGYDLMPEGADQYIWIRWDVNVYSGEGVRDVYASTHNAYRTIPTECQNTLYFIEHIPEDAIVYDMQMNPIENNNGIAKITSFASGYYYAEDSYYRITSQFLIGYPKETYKDQKIENTIDAYGVFWDETEATYLCTGSTTINMADYIFTGSGGTHSHWKRDANWDISSDRSKFDYAYTSYSIGIGTVYSGTMYDVEIYDDLIFCPNSDNEYVKMQDNEYCYTGIDWNGDTLKNSNNGTIQPYTMEIWVRYEGETNFVLFKDNLIANKSYTGGNQINFTTAEKKVVAWKATIKDVRESIKCSWSYFLSCYLKIYKKDIADNGYVYNFSHFRVYENGIFINPATIENYGSTMTQMDIATYDIATYNTYVNRSVGKGKIINSNLRFRIYKDADDKGKLTNNTKLEKFTGSYSIYPTVNTEYGITDTFDGFLYYDLLPIGMEYENLETLEITNKNNILTLKTASGITLTKEYLEEHRTVNAIENWNNTNRTLLVMEFDFSDDPLNLCPTRGTLTFPSFKINVSVSYDSYLEYGTSYKNTAYMDLINNDKIIYVISKHNPTIEEFDFNENGEIENLMTATNTLLISDLVASHQDVQTQVQSDVSNFSIGVVDAPADSVYTYKLKVRTGQTDVTNFTIYCNIETASKRPQWKGKFQGIDTTFASKTYTIKTYYSEKENAGSLNTDTSWKEYDEMTIDKTKVKSLAFQYLDNDGNPALLPSGTYTYVLVKMKAPLDEYTTLAYNRCWTQWNAVDEFNRPVDFITGIQSNIVKVALPSSVKGMWKTVVNITFNKVIHGEKIDFDNMNLNQFNNYNFQVTLTNQDTGDVHTGLLSSQNGLTFGLLPAGIYLITESDDNYFDFIEMIDGNDSEIIMEGITFEKVGENYLLTILEDVEEDIYFQVNITNKIEDNRFYEDKNDRENYFLINKINNGMMDPDEPQGH